MAYRLSQRRKPEKIIKLWCMKCDKLTPHKYKQTIEQKLENISRKVIAQRICENCGTVNWETEYYK